MNKNAVFYLFIILSLCLLPCCSKDGTLPVSPDIQDTPDETQDAGTPGNRNPVINEFTINPSTMVTNQIAVLTVNASDPDAGDTLSFSFLVVSGSGTLGGADTASGKTYKAPASPGTAQLSVAVSDGKGVSAVRTASVTVVTSAGLNNSPVIQSFAADDYNLRLGESALLTVTASDPDPGTTLLYNYEIVSGGGQLTGSITASETYTAGAPWTIGVKTLRVTVSDGMGGSAQSNISLSVDPNNLGVLVINEVYSATGNDYMEIKNRSSTNFYVAENSLQYGDAAHLVVMPAGVLIPANDYLVIYCDETSDPGPGGDFEYIWAPPGMQFGLGSSDVARILSFGGTLIDSYSWSSHADNISKGRLPDGTGSWDTTCTPTPGEPNQDHP